MTYPEFPIWHFPRLVRPQLRFRPITVNFTWLKKWASVKWPNFITYSPRCTSIGMRVFHSVAMILYKIESILCIFRSGKESVKVNFNFPQYLFLSKLHFMHLYVFVYAGKWNCREILFYIFKTVTILIRNIFSLELHC